MLTVGSLFSGIGGLDLGFEWTGGFRVLWQVESGFIEGDSPEQTTRLTEKNRAFLWGVLARHWPHATRYSDVRSVGATNLPAVDVIVGGFPCQDISIAGKGAGLAGARSGLWGEFRRIVGELRPRYVVVENVSALLARGMGTVLGDLSALGYDAVWTTVRARDVGAPHERARIFIVAWLADADCRRGDGVPQRDQPRDMAAEPLRRGGRHDAREVGVADADPSGQRSVLGLLPSWQSDARRRGLEVVADADDAGRGQRRGPVAASSEQPPAQRDGDVADAEGARLQEPGGLRHDLAGRAHAAVDGPHLVADPDGGRCEGLGVEEPPREQGARGSVADGRGGARGLDDGEDVADAGGERRDGGQDGAPGSDRHGDDARREQEAGGPLGDRQAHGHVADPERDPLRLEPERDQWGGRRDGASERGHAELGDRRASRRRAAQCAVGRGAHGIPPRVDRWPAGPSLSQEEWEPPRASTKKDPYRRLRLRALGNAVVPQVAEVVGVLLLRIDAWLSSRNAA